MAAVVAVLVMVIVLVVRLVGNRTPSADTFCEGVYVNGLALGGMTYEEGVQAVNSGIDKRLHQDSFLLTCAGRQWTFTPATFNAELDLTTQLGLAWNFGHAGTAGEKRDQAAYVKANPVYYESEIKYDTVMLDDFIAQIQAEVNVPPVNASVIVEPDEMLTIIPSQDGLRVPSNKLHETLEQWMREGSDTAAVELVPEVWEADITTAELEQNTQLIVTYSTPTNASSILRTRNIRRALSSFDGLVINPGETISFNQIVGKRTKANGFFEANEYDGTTVVTGIGGGTCQASSTLYGALLLANIDVTVRQCHTMTVAYVKPSFDAVVSDKGKDLKFTNNQDYPMYFYTSVDSSRAEVRVYGPPCKYEIKLENEILQTLTPQKNKYVPDESGKFVYYVDEDPVLKSEGKDGLKSRGYRVYYDRETGAEVERQALALDTYYSSQPVYWRGVHPYE
ncbi:MAG: VanW family protein [Clostridia bacterium]